MPSRWSIWPSTRSPVETSSIGPGLRHLGHDPLQPAPPYDQPEMDIRYLNDPQGIDLGRDLRRHYGTMLRPDASRIDPARDGYNGDDDEGEGEVGARREGKEREVPARDESEQIEDEAIAVNDYQCTDEQKKQTHPAIADKGHDAAEKHPSGILGQSDDERGSYHDDHEERQDEDERKARAEGCSHADEHVEVEQAVRKEEGCEENHHVFYYVAKTGHLPRRFVGGTRRYLWTCPVLFCCEERALVLYSETNRCGERGLKGGPWPCANEV